MNQEIKQRWISKLRSGEYKQGKNRLKNLDGSMCCLGVLCELYREDHPGIEWIECIPDNSFSILNSVDILPKSIMIWAELNSTCGNIGNLTLGYMNDIANYDFNKIADIIEKEL